MDSNKAIKQIDKLINDYKEASLKSKYDDLSDLHNDALTKSIKIRALNIIEAVTEEGSVYRRQAYHSGGRCVSIPELMGILEPLKTDLKNERIKSNKKTTTKEKNRTSDGNDVITKEDIEKYTLIQLVKRLSIGAWLWILGILIGVFWCGIKAGLHFEQTKGLFK